MNIMTEAQAHAARQLARAFGHTWGQCEGTEGLLSPEDISAAVDREVYAIWDDSPGAKNHWIWGICSPNLVNGQVVHETCTRNTLWVVNPDGSVQVQFRHGREAGVLKIEWREGRAKILRSSDSEERWEAAQALSRKLGWQVL